MLSKRIMGFCLSELNHSGLSALDDTEVLLYGSKTGRPSYALLTLFRMFCDLELGGDVPYTQTLGQFRHQLMNRDLC